MRIVFDIRNDNKLGVAFYLVNIWAIFRYMIYGVRIVFIYVILIDDINNINALTLRFRIAFV